MAGGAAIRISILANAANAIRGIRDTNGELGALGRTGSRVGGALKTGLVGGAVAAAAGLAVFAKTSLEGAQESLKIHQVFESQLNKLGDAGRKAFGDGAKFAGTFGDQIAEDDDRVLQVVNKLSTFPNAFKKGTLGAEAMRRATRAAFDLEATGIGSAEGNIIGIGKALDNPVKGMTALSKAGVSFSEAEAASIKAAVKRGDIAKAQQILLKGIESNAKGAAKAAVTGLDRAKASLANFGEGLAAQALPALNEFGDWFADKGLPAIEGFTTKAQDALGKLFSDTGVGGKLTNTLKTAFGELGPQIIPTIKNIATALAPVVGALVAAFKENLPKAVAAAKSVFATFAPVVAVVAGVIVSVSKVLVANLPAAIGVASAAVGVLLGILGSPVFQAVVAGIGAMVVAFKVYRGIVVAAAAAQAVYAAVAGGLPAVLGAARFAVFALNAVFAANPFGIIVLAIAGVVTALVVLYKRSQTAREIMSTAFAAIGLVVLTAAQVMLKGYKFMTTGVLSAVEIILKAVAKIPGPTQDAAKKALKGFQDFKSGVEGTFDKIDGTLEGYKQSLLSLPQKIKLQGDETDLKEKIAQGQADLKKLPREKQTVIRAEIADATRKLDLIRAKLLGIKDRFVKVFIDEQNRDRATAGRGGVSAQGLGPNFSAEIKELQAGGAAFLTTLQTSVGPIVQAGIDLAAQLGAARNKYAQDTADADNQIREARSALADVQLDYNRMVSDTAREERRAAAETAKARKAVGAAKTAADKKAANADLKRAIRDEQDLIRNNNRTQLDDKKKLNEALDRVDDALRGKTDLRLTNGILLKPNQVRKLQAYIKAQAAELQKLGDLQEATARSLEDATARLADAVKARDDFAASIADSVARSGSLLSLDKEDDGSTTTASILDQFKKRARAAADFAANILGLQSKGLNQSLVTELAGAGVDSAGSTVAALLTASPAELSAINASQADIIASGERLGKALASTFFESGVSQAQALVDGLKSKQAELEATMRALAKAANDAYSKALETGRAPTATSVLAASATASNKPATGSVLTISIPGSGATAEAGREIIRQIAAYTKENGPAQILVAR